MSTYLRTRSAVATIAVYCRRYFPSDTAYRELLVAEGFDVESCALVYRPTVLPTDVMGWLQTFCTSFLDLVPEQRRDQVHTSAAVYYSSNSPASEALTGQMPVKNVLCLRAS